MKHLIPLSSEQLERIQNNLDIEPVLSKEILITLAEQIQLLCSTEANPYQVAFKLAESSMWLVPQPESLTKYVVALALSFLAINDFSTRNTLVCLKYVCSRTLLKRKRAEADSSMTSIKFKKENSACCTNITV